MGHLSLIYRRKVLFIMKVKDIEHYITDETLAQFSKFICIEELDAVYWEHVNRIEESDLKPSWKEKLLKLFHRIKTITEKGKFHIFFESQKVTAKMLGLKKSDTIGEWIKKLVDLGIVSKVPTKRGNNYQSVNVIIINPIHTDKSDVEEKNGELDSPKNGEQQISSFSGLSFYNISLHNYVEQTLLKKLNEEDIKPPSVPDEFYETVKPYFSGQVVLNLWDRVKIASKKCRLIHEPVKTAIDAFRTSLSFYKHKQLKNGQSLDAFFGFFYGRVNYLIKEQLNDYNTQTTQNSISNHPVFYDWLKLQ